MFWLYKAIIRWLHNIIHSIVMLLHAIYVDMYGEVDLTLTLFICYSNVMN
jgi:hypothetical protein